MTTATANKATARQEVILVVDDEDAIRGALVRVLESRGYKVLAARSAEEAATVPKRFREPIDLLITDIVMPGMSGPRFADGLLQENPTMKVLFCSGHVDPSIVHYSPLGEEVPFLQKPFTIDIFADKVRQVLNEPKRRTSWRTFR